MRLLHFLEYLSANKTEIKAKNGAMSAYIFLIEKRGQNGKNVTERMHNFILYGIFKERDAIKKKWGYTICCITFLFLFFSLCL